MKYISHIRTMLMTFAFTTFTLFAIAGVVSNMPQAAAVEQNPDTDIVKVSDITTSEEITPVVEPPALVGDENTPVAEHAEEITPIVESSVPVGDENTPVAEHAEDNTPAVEPTPPVSEDGAPVAEPTKGDTPENNAETPAESNGDTSGKDAKTTAVKLYTMIDVCNWCKEKAEDICGRCKEKAKDAIETWKHSSTGVKVLIVIGVAGAVISLLVGVEVAEIGGTAIYLPIAVVGVATYKLVKFAYQIILMPINWVRNMNQVAPILVPREALAQVAALAPQAEALAQVAALAPHAENLTQVANHAGQMLQGVQILQAIQNLMRQPGVGVA